MDVFPIDRQGRLVNKTIDAIIDTLVKQVAGHPNIKSHQESNNP